MLDASTSSGSADVTDDADSENASPKGIILPGEFASESRGDEFRELLGEDSSLILVSV